MGYPSIPCTCLNCGNTFLGTSYQIKKGWGKFCSRTCYTVYRNKQIEARFWKRIDFDGPTPKHRPELGPCWLWTGGKVYEYGATSYQGRSIRAHRLAFRLATKTDPGDKCVLHHCDNPPCVRPDHLWIGTQADNHNDMKAKGRNRRGNEHWTRINPEKIRRGDKSYQRQHPEWLARGERHGNSVLTEAVVQEMRHLRRNGTSYGRIARQFKVSKSATVAAIKYLTWKHVT